MRHQFVHEIFGLSGSELFIKGNDQEMPDAKRASQRDLMLPGGEQMRRFFRPEHFFWMRIKRDNYGRFVCGLSVLRRRGDQCLVDEMDGSQQPDGEKIGARQVTEL